MNIKNDSFGKMKRREWSRRGGKATVKKHGRDHMSKIGKSGARVFWKRYTLRPTGTADFAIVKREGGEVIGFMSGKRVK